MSNAVSTARAWSARILTAGAITAVSVFALAPAALATGPGPASDQATPLDRLARSTTPLRATSQAALSRRAAAIVGRSDAAFSASCGGGVIEVNSNRVMRGASSMKVAVALAAIRRARMSPATIASDSSMRAMIIDSDNDAANRVIDRAGGLQAVTRWMNGVGMTQSALRANYGVDYMSRTKKVTTAADMRLLADKLRQLTGSGSGSLASMGYTRAQGLALLGLMERTTHTGLFGGGTSAVVAHKSGWLPGVENDVAIVTLPKGKSCAMSLLTDGVGVSGAQAMGASLMRSVVAPLADLRSR